jgi:hypothetical protein
LRPQALDHKRILARAMSGVGGAAAGSGPSLHVEGFLDAERNAIQRAERGVVAPTLVTFGGGPVSALEIRHHHRVNGRVRGEVGVFASVHQFGRAGLSGLQPLHGAPERREAKAVPAVARTGQV